MSAELTPSQKSWTPWLYDSRMTLRQLYEELPGDTARGTPWYVKLLENPQSPMALAGAVDLFTHDCIHLVLGRGLLPQDEAFVLGFTMGTNRASPWWHPYLLGFCAQHLYRGVYRFSELERNVFQFAFAVGQLSPVPSLRQVDFRALFDESLDRVRAKLGLDARLLSEIYQGERLRWPETSASRRLGTSSLGGLPVGVTAEA